MTVKVETYYDFRSPYAYFADYRIRNGDVGLVAEVEWIGRPIFVDVILNLQAGKEPWAPYVDTLIPPKRTYLMADIRRMAAFYGVPYRPSWRWPDRHGRFAAPFSMACGTGSGTSPIHPSCEIFWCKLAVMR